MVATPRVAAGSHVTLHYRIAVRLDGNEHEVVSTFDARPATVQVGAGQFSEALEQRLIGLEEGQEAMFDLAAGEGVVVVSAVVLDGRGVDAGPLPRQVEVVVNVSGEPRGWRAVTSETLTYTDGVAQVRFAPLRARLVRLNFSGTMNGGKVITLRRVELRQD
jgi:hypothetical protein